MAQGELLDVLLAHDRWATAQVLDACAKLTDEQFHRRFGIGHGSLHDTLAHVVSVVRVFTETLAGWDARPRPDADGRRRTQDELRSLLEESCQQYAAEAPRRPPSETVTRRTRDGRVLVMTRAAVIAHVATHGAHHRAQCLNMLRHLGVTPLPPSSVAEWTWTGESPK